MTTHHEIISQTLSERGCKTLDEREDVYKELRGHLEQSMAASRASKSDLRAELKTFDRAMSDIENNLHGQDTAEPEKESTLFTLSMLAAIMVVIFVFTHFLVKFGFWLFDDKSQDITQDRAQKTYEASVEKPPVDWSKLRHETWNDDIAPILQSRLQEFQPDIDCVIAFDNLPYDTEVLFTDTDGPKVIAWYKGEQARFASCIDQVRLNAGDMATTFLNDLFLSLKEEHNLESKEFYEIFQNDVKTQEAHQKLAQNVEGAIASERKKHKRKLRRHVDDVLKPAYKKGDKIDRQLAQKEAEKQAAKLAEAKPKTVVRGWNDGLRTLNAISDMMAEEEERKRLKAWDEANKQAQLAEMTLKWNEAKKGETYKPGEPHEKRYPKGREKSGSTCPYPPFGKFAACLKLIPGTTKRDWAAEKACNEKSKADNRASLEKWIANHANRAECKDRIQSIKDNLSGKYKGYSSTSGGISK